MLGRYLWFEKSVKTICQKDKGPHQMYRKWPYDKKF